MGSFTFEACRSPLATSVCLRWLVTVLRGLKEHSGDRSLLVALQGSFRSAQTQAWEHGQRV